MARPSGSGFGVRAIPAMVGHIPGAIGDPRAIVRPVTCELTRRRAVDLVRVATALCPSR